MPISFDKALGIHTQALLLAARRSEYLASNIANADTPNYKAKDVDFRAALQDAQDQQSVQLATTDPRHLQVETGGAGNAQYRVPEQSSLDGNTVDLQQEKAAFADNALRYQASLRFLNGRFELLRLAIKGE